MPASPLNNRSHRVKSTATFRWLVFPTLAISLFVGILLWHSATGVTPAAPVVALPSSSIARNLPSSPSAPVTAQNSSAPTPAELARRAVLFPAFQKHPFAAVRESNAFGWTAEDGRDPGVIKQIAHNELEFDRLAGENSRIDRRQLVYHKDTVDAQIQRAKLAGQPLRELTLPGLDGQEVQFEITATDLSPSGQQGTFSGHVANQPASMVTFAFKEIGRAHV